MTPSTARLSPREITPESSRRLAAELQTSATVTIGRETVDLTPEARTALAHVFELLGSGMRVDVAPVAETLTTQQAADLVGVSRPTLVKLLETGHIPYEQPGVHRRISRTSVEAFLAEKQSRRRHALDALAAEFDPDLPDEFIATR